MFDVNDSLCPSDNCQLFGMRKLTLATRFKVIELNLGINKILSYFYQILNVE